MIRVQERPEPPHFDARVRQRGRAWLASQTAAPSASDLRPYWRECLDDLRSAYKSICAYYCCKVEEITQPGSVEHFVPKSRAHAQAYEWSNYRFASQRANTLKGIADIADPFLMIDGDLEIIFPTMTIRVPPSVVSRDRELLDATITCLDLNGSRCTRDRQLRWEYYINGDVSARHLYEYAPFIALEAARQGLLKPEDQHITVIFIRQWLDAP